MYGNWRYNASIGLAGAILVFLIGLANNPILLSLLRSFYGFLAFFIVAYFIRFILGTFIFPKTAKPEAEKEAHDKTSGQNIDYVAQRDDENLNDLLKEQLNKNVSAVNKTNNEGETEGKVEEEVFKPLKPTQLFSSKSVEPEEMSKAIRHLTGE